MLIAVLVASAVLSGCAGSHVCTEITQRDFRVERVIDGDTFVVRYDGELTSVRIYGIDTPERGEPGFAEAKAALETQILGRTVRLSFPSQRKRDNFGRLLCAWQLIGGGDS